MQARSRGGFTLIELMVAMALTLFVMVILTQAFSIALDTFINAKGVGDLQQNLRVVSVLIGDDLRHDHLDGKRRLSDIDASGVSQLVLNRPTAGFLAVVQGSPSVLEGNDQNGMPSYRAVDHVLYMTVKRKGNRPENFFAAALNDNTVPVGSPSTLLSTFFANATAYGMTPNAFAAVTHANPYPGSAPSQWSYNSQWAEVIYYLVRTGTSEQPLNPAATIGTFTYSLMRAEFVMAPDGTTLNGRQTPLIAGAIPLTSVPAAPSVGPFDAMSCSRGPAAHPYLRFNSPSDVATQLTTGVANTRIGGNAATIRARLPANLAAMPANRLGVASTLVLPNVVSFQIQIMPTSATTFMDVPVTNIPAIPAPPTVPTQGYYYDTAAINGPPNGVNAGYSNNFGLKAIQITVRVFDSKTRQTRQITIVQDL